MKKKAGVLALGHGLFFVTDGKTARVEVRQVPSLARAVGARRLTGLVAALHASERMISLVDLYLANLAEKKGEPAAIRNRYHLGVPPVSLTRG
jgi:hypothetical protein